MNLSDQLAAQREVLTRHRRTADAIAADSRLIDQITKENDAALARYQITHTMPCGTVAYWNGLHGQWETDRSFGSVYDEGNARKALAWHEGRVVHGRVAMADYEGMDPAPSNTQINLAATLIMNAVRRDEEAQEVERRSRGQS